MTPRNVIVILGPTASGKSKLGVRLAKKFHGVVISADSRQVYKGMDIGTGKITRKEMDGVPHYLLSVASPKTQYSVARYVQDVQKIMKKIPPAVPIFLVGGSAFYIKALTEPHSFSLVPPNQALRRQLERKTTAQLLALVKKKDSVRYATIDPANRRRLIRAVEVASFVSPLPKKSITKAEVSALRVLKIGLSVPRPELLKRIDRRIDTRMKRGMLEEVRKLRHQGVSWKKLEAFGLEYRFLARQIQGKLSKAEAIQQLKSSTHDFAKRQMTWWKRDQDIRWIQKSASGISWVKTFLG